MNIEMIRAAADRLRGHARETPLLTSPFIDHLAGRRVLIKAECLQHTGSFKYRGGYSAVSALPEDVRANGVIAFSSGNHAQGVALAATQHEVPSVIIMPSDAPRLKIENTRALGAEVVLYDRATEDRDAIGARMAAERGLTLIKPFDEPQVIAGQGTTGLEIAVQARALGVEEADVLVCCGGGGLTSGIALALEAEAPGLRARPVEPKDFDDTARSLASGTIERNAAMTGSICDAIVTPSPGNADLSDHAAPLRAGPCRHGSRGPACHGAGFFAAEDRSGTGRRRGAGRRTDPPRPDRGGCRDRRRLGRQRGSRDVRTGAEDLEILIPPEDSHQVIHNLR